VPRWFAIPGLRSLTEKPLAGPRLRCVLVPYRSATIDAARTASVQLVMRTLQEIRIRRPGPQMPQPERVLDPSLSPEAWYGHEIRLRRKTAGFTTAAPFARELQVSVDVILKVEKGEYRCPRDLGPKLDQVLHTDGLFTRAWAMAFGDADKKRGDADKRRDRGSGRSASVVEGGILGTDDPSTRSHDPVHRRAFLAVSGLAALAPTDLASLVPSSVRH
jgi:ribosome-binding protein aMBF1 (putative translation factor)